MKNILSSLNESEKRRILEMHYRASNRHYLMEATNADYNVIKTSVDATYKETLNKFLMAGVSLIDPDDKGKPTKIQFDPLDPNQSYSAINQLMGTPVERKIGNPTYKCAGTVQSNMVDETGKPAVTYWDDHLNAQEIYSRSIGAEGNQPRAAARTLLTTELGKVAVAACKAIDALSKGLPNPLIKQTTTKTTTPKKTSTGGGTVPNLAPDGPSYVITLDQIKAIYPNATLPEMNYHYGQEISMGLWRMECYNNKWEPTNIFTQKDVDWAKINPTLVEPLRQLFAKQCATNLAYKKNMK